MRADSLMINQNSSLLGTTYYGYMFDTTPKSNIESNLQTVGQIYANTIASGTDSINPKFLYELQTVANLCPYTDGAGVYQARSLLDYYTGTITVYNDEVCGSMRLGHKVIKDSNSAEISDTVKNISFSLYPNPNNGSFTFVYNFGNETTGKLEIFNDVSMEVGEYSLNSANGTMSIVTQGLGEGLYFYKVITDSGTKKVGKLVIIR